MEFKYSYCIPPLNFNGNFTLQVTATTTEKANSDSATNSGTLNIMVYPVDVPESYYFIALEDPQQQVNIPDFNRSAAIDLPLNVNVNSSNASGNYIYKNINSETFNLTASSSILFGVTGDAARNTTININGSSGHKVIFDSVPAGNVNVNVSSGSNSVLYLPGSKSDYNLNALNNNNGVYSGQISNSGRSLTINNFSAIVFTGSHEVLGNVTYQYIYPADIRLETPIAGVEQLVIRNVPADSGVKIYQYGVLLIPDAYGHYTVSVNPETGIAENVTYVTQTAMTLTQLQDLQGQFQLEIVSGGNTFIAESDSTTASSMATQNDGEGYLSASTEHSEGVDVAPLHVINASIVDETSLANILHGDSKDNVIYGSAGDDIIYSGDSHDLIFGDDGNDLLFGENGNDTIYGGKGDDIMTGGGGIDTFVWMQGDDGSVGSPAVDRITDFKANPVGSSTDASILNLSDLLSGEHLNADSLDNYLNISKTGSDTTIKIDPNGTDPVGHATQTIILQGVDLTALFSTTSSHDIVNHLIANGNIITDH